MTPAFFDQVDAEMAGQASDAPAQAASPNGAGGPAVPAPEAAVADASAVPVSSGVEAALADVPQPDATAAAPAEGGVAGGHPGPGIYRPDADPVWDHVAGGVVGAFLIGGAAVMLLWPSGSADHQPAVAAKNVPQVVGSPGNTPTETAQNAANKPAGTDSAPDTKTLSEDATAGGTAKASDALANAEKGSERKTDSRVPTKEGEAEVAGDGKANAKKGTGGAGSVVSVRGRKKPGKKTARRNRKKGSKGGNARADSGKGDPKKSAKEGGKKKSSRKNRFSTPGLRERKVAMVKSGGGGARSGLSPDEAARRAMGVIKNHQRSLKICYDRALKRQGMGVGGRVDVTVSVGTSGRVTDVAMGSKAGLESFRKCVGTTVSKWAFPAATEGYAVGFPLILSPNR